MIIFMFAMLKQIINSIFEPIVNIDEIIKSNNKLRLSKLWIDKPRMAEKKFINNKTIIVFRNLRFTRFLLNSIEIFIMLDMMDIRIYPMISEYVPVNLGKNIIHKIRIADEMA